MAKKKATTKASAGAPRARAASGVKTVGKSKSGKAKPVKGAKGAAKEAKGARPSKPEPPDIGPPANPAEAALRDFALSLPHATEHFPWGHRVAKINGKVFIIMGGGEGKLTASVKLPGSAAEALETGFCEPTGYGLGKSGWVTASFEGSDKVPLATMRKWITESYLAVAPKKIAAEYRGGGGRG
jgi:predicted DNA-binding protein (MmcQ/YjbR family)